MRKFYKSTQLHNNNFFIDTSKHNLIQYINESKKGNTLWQAGKAITVQCLHSNNVTFNNQVNYGGQNNKM